MGLNWGDESADVGEKSQTNRAAVKWLADRAKFGKGEKSKELLDYIIGMETALNKLSELYPLSPHIQIIINKALK